MCLPDIILPTTVALNFEFIVIAAVRESAIASPRAKRVQALLVIRVQDEKSSRLRILLNKQSEQIDLLTSHHILVRDLQFTNLSTSRGRGGGYEVSTNKKT